MPEFVMYLVVYGLFALKWVGIARLTRRGKHGC